MTYLKMKEYSRAVVSVIAYFYLLCRLMLIRYPFFFFFDQIDCNSALHIEPSHVKSLMRRATANNALGKHRAALKDLLCAADLEPTK